MSRHRSGKAYQFGDSGTRLVEWIGDPPEQVFGGGPPYASRKKYNFASKNPRHVDYRDLPCLVKDAGRENLKDLGEGTQRPPRDWDNPIAKLPREKKPKEPKDELEVG